MIDRVASLGRGSVSSHQPSEFSVPIKLSIVIGIAASCLLLNGGAQILAQCLSEAFLQVTVFVAATLAIFYFLEAWFKIDATAILARHYKWQVPIAAGLGALPGCGGAIIVITQFIRGGISFGSVVAVLTATMGDAAFLLLAKAPSVGLLIFAIGLVVGIISGYAVDKIHGPTFLRQDRCGIKADNRSHVRYVGSSVCRSLWIIFLLPGIVLGGFVAFQANTLELFGLFWGLETITWFGLAGGAITLLLWALMRQPNSDNKANNREFYQTSTRMVRLGDAAARVAGDTSFITVWVSLAFLIYELAVNYAGLDIKYFFSTAAPLVPFVAILVGLIPGCGPQVVITSMYLSGIIPFSAEIGNSISNDGDALFPAIAIAPQVAVIATLYSAVPAFIVAYGYYWLFE